MRLRCPTQSSKIAPKIERERRRKEKYRMEMGEQQSGKERMVKQAPLGSCKRLIGSKERIQ